MCILKIAKRLASIRNLARDDVDIVRVLGAAMATEPSEIR